MKKFVVITLIAFIAMAQLIYAETYYTRPNCKVVHVENDVVTVKDTGDNLWAFRGEGYKKHDTVTLKMHTNHTNTFKDDIIVEVK